MFMSGRNFFCFPAARQYVSSVIHGPPEYRLEIPKEVHMPMPMPIHVAPTLPRDKFLVLQFCLAFLCALESAPYVHLIPAHDQPSISLPSRPRPNQTSRRSRPCQSPLSTRPWQSRPCVQSEYTSPRSPDADHRRR